MPYTTNKHIPRIRRDAARLFRKGWSARKIGRYLGYHHTAIMEWVRKAEKIGDVPIPTRSSEPKRKWRKTNPLLEEKIVQIRKETKRCTEAIHLMLLRDGIVVPKSTIHRVLDRNGLLKKRSPYKRYHPHQDRPYPLHAGDLIEVDTIHLMISEKKRIYVFALIDVYSRWVYAKSYDHINGKMSLLFVQEAQRHASFQFRMLQSDHGPEFSSWFVERMKTNHRYTRIGKPNDNAHIERFNRTVQEECLDKIPNDVRKINCALKKYLPYYNHQRVHLGLNATPNELLV
jgi:putative transposase